MDNLHRCLPWLFLFTFFCKLLSIYRVVIKIIKVFNFSCEIAICKQTHKLGNWFFNFFNLFRNFYNIKIHKLPLMLAMNSQCKCLHWWLIYFSHNMKSPLSLQYPTSERMNNILAIDSWKAGRNKTLILHQNGK